MLERNSAWQISYPLLVMEKCIGKSDLVTSGSGLLDEFDIGASGVLKECLGFL